MPIPWERYMPGGFYRQQMALSPIVELRESPFSQIPPSSRWNLIKNANNENSTVDCYFPGTYERPDGVRSSFGSIRTNNSTVSSKSEKDDSQFLELADEAEEHEPDPSDPGGGSQRMAFALPPTTIPNFSLPGRGTKRPIFPSRLGNGKIEAIDWAYNARDLGRRRSSTSGHWRNFSLPSNAGVIRRASVG